MQDIVKTILTVASMLLPYHFSVRNVMMRAPRL